MALKQKIRANKNATKGKKQAWKKGQSSSYNPECKKFREAAKNRAKFGYKGSNSKLTELALSQHNKEASRFGSKSDLNDDFDGTSIGGLSFVSTFSNCTNPSFNRLLQRWQSNSFLHKEMLAVLAAVTEVIKAKGGKETETEYFAALMTTLDIADTDEGRTAVLSLLYMVVKRLPVSVLKLNFSKTGPILKGLLLKYVDSDFNALLRNILGCLFCFLKAQEPCNWSNDVKEVFTVLLQCTVHHKPKVRKCAQSAVIYLLNKTNAEMSGEGSVHSSLAVTAQFCVEKIESNAGAEGSVMYHVLNLLKGVMGYFPRASLKLCCETILRVMTLSNSIVTSSCLKALQGMFLNNPKPENLPDELNVRIIKALYDYQPNVNDEEILIEWLLLMEYAFINLYRLNPSLCISHLPNFTKSAVACYLSDKHKVHPAVTSTLKNILQSCIVSSSPEFQQFILDDPINNPMCKMFQFIEKALSYQYHKAWKEVLIALAQFFYVMGKHLYPVMIKCLQSLADLRNSVKFPHISELENAVGMAIHKMGPDVVLKAVPLQITGEKENDGNFPRSWLLPLLEKNIKEAKLGFFISYFLPLVSQVRKKALESRAEEKIPKLSVYDTICLQIWSLLPSFCTSPTDLKQSFKAIARILGTALNEQPEVRLPILKGLRILIRTNLDNEENREEIARFAKNYLPILFNLFTIEPTNAVEKDVRKAVLETIGVYLQITDKELCLSLFMKTMEKLKDATSFTQLALLELTSLLIPYVSEDRIKELYEYCKPLLHDMQHSVQKRSYKVLQMLFADSSETCLAFVQKNIDDLKSVLLTTLSTSSTPAKAKRLDCLQKIVHYLSKENKDFILAIIPEAILCTKATGTKARNAAYKLLEDIGHTLFRWEPENKRRALCEYIQMLLVGFAGEPHFISATILSVAHVVFKFKDELDTDLINLLIENVCLLLTSRSREIVTAGLSFFKDLFSTISTRELAQHVEKLIKSIASISQDNQRAIRFKARELFTRLIRKFGYEMISKLAPEQFQKQLVNIRKIEGRKAKRKSLHVSATEVPNIKPKSDLIDDVLVETDEEVDDTVSDIVSKGNKKTWIEEGENEIVDFMDPSANKKILASKPTESKKIQSTEFELAEDGRMIIPNDEEVSRKRKRKAGNDEGNKLNESQKKKQKIQNDSGEEEDESDDDVNSCKTVTKGIHRTLKPKVPAAKKAGGDVKKGKLDPYSYIPLNRQMLNKRKQKKLQGQFRGVVHAAKRGANKGSKQKTQKRRK